MPYVNVGTHRLWITDKGAGVPVVLLHSLFFDGRVFEPVEDDLLDEYRVLVVDVRDHGRSEGPSARWSLTDAASEIERATSQLHQGPVHVVGLSMGGMIALRWALAHPDRVRSLSLLSTSAHSESRAWLHKAMTQLVRFGGRGATKLVLPYAIRKMFSPSARESPEAKRWRQRIAAEDPKRLYRGGQAVFDRDAIVDQLDRIQTPALVLVGSEDEAIAPEHGHRLAEGLPDAEIVEVPDAGHMLPLEAPATVGDELVHFLRRAQAKTVDA